MEIWEVSSWVSIGIALYDDVKEHRIRWVPIVVCMGVGLIAQAAMDVFEWKTVVFGVVPGVLSFLVGKLCNECIGAGDSLMILNIGLLRGVSFCLTTVLIACICVFLFSVVMLFFKRIHRKSQIACVPFLFIGSIGASFL